MGACTGVQCSIEILLTKTLLLLLSLSIVSGQHCYVWLLNSNVNERTLLDEYSDNFSVHTNYHTTVRLVIFAGTNFREIGQNSDFRNFNFHDW